MRAVQFAVSRSPRMKMYGILTLSVLSFSIRLIFLTFEMFENDANIFVDISPAGHNATCTCHIFVIYFLIK